MTRVDEFLISRYDDLMRGAVGNLSLSVEDRSLILTLAQQLKVVVEFHKNWPVLVTTKPELEMRPDDSDTWRYQLTQQMNWLTQEEYVKKFGTDPPTAPLLVKLLESWTHHPDYDPMWGGNVVRPDQGL